MPTIREMGVFSITEGISRRVEQTLRSGARGEETAREGEQTRKAAQEFAALLVYEVIKAMRAAVPAGGLFESDSLSNDVYHTLVDLEVSRLIARRDGIGLTGLIESGIEHRSLPSLRPVAGDVSSPFGLRQDPLDPQKRFHRGVDIAAAEGTPVRAVAPGRVLFSADAPGYGKLVTIDHGSGLVTRYAHNGVNLVSAGARVAAGQEVGLVGSTGRSAGPHLHFEVVRNGRAVDPQPFLAGSRAF